MTKSNNPMIIQKDTAPYMYLTEYSGIYLNEYNPLTLNRGVKFLVNEAQSPVHYLVSLQVWFRFPLSSFDSTLPLFSINADGLTIDFTCTPMADSKRARITASETVTMYKNGNYCSSVIIHAEEWVSLYVIFETPVPFVSYQGDITFHPNFVFNNMSQFIYENQISTITSGTNLAWSQVLQPTNLITNTWQDVLTNEVDWLDVLSYFTTQSDFALSGDYIYGNQVGTSVIVNDDLSTLKTYSNGIDIFSEVEWQKIEKDLV